MASGAMTCRQPRLSKRQRTLWLKGEGFRVVRFWNNDVLLNIEGVVRER
ncbi:MAG: DUF559 domain-containing protein [Chloroflexota bacterium]